MTAPDLSLLPLSPSQQSLQVEIQAALFRRHGPRRPLLLTGDPGTGKSHLARRLAASSCWYFNFASEGMLQLLAQTSLSRVTPESIIRHVREAADGRAARLAVVDGLEPFVALWAVQRPALLTNFFNGISRVVFDQPTVLVVQTSPDYLPASHFSQDHWWPFEIHFHLTLTLADKEVVASNWGLDPFRAPVANNLHQLLATKLERQTP